MRLEFVSGSYSVCKLSSDAVIPEWLQGQFISISRSDSELSIVAETDCVPEGVEREDDWCCLRAAGQLDFGLVGVLAGICSVLAAAGVPVFVISTFETDYLLVKQEFLEAARHALITADYEVE